MRPLGPIGPSGLARWAAGRRSRRRPPRRLNFNRLANLQWRDFRLRRRSRWRSFRGRPPRTGVNLADEARPGAGNRPEVRPGAGRAQWAARRDEWDEQVGSRWAIRMNN